MQQVGPLPVGVGAEVELQRLGGGGGGEAKAALGLGQVAGQGDHRRVVRDGAEVVADEQLGGDEPQRQRRAAGQGRFGGVHHLAEAGAGPGPQGGQTLGEADGLHGGGRAHVVAPVA